jgi:hypothetical protein
VSIDYKIDELAPSIEGSLTRLKELGLEGWELMHYYNRDAWLKSSAGGTIQSGSFNMANDAFGRGRVSIPFTLGDYKHVYGAAQVFTFTTGSGGNITEDIDRASVDLSVSGSGSFVIYQSRMYHNYMPGKSQYILASFVMGESEEGVIKRIGYFDEYNGIYLEQNESGSLSWNIRSSTSGTGSIIINSVPQEEWNVNTLDNSVITLDLTKTQLIFIDFQWLAVGRVRCGFVIKGIPVVTHVFDHSNITDVAYMSNPNLPLRCEIRAVTNATGSIEAICGSVQSEGGYDEAGFVFSQASQTFRSLGNAATLPVIAIKLKNKVQGRDNRSYVRVEDFSAFTDQQTIRYGLYKLPSTGSLTGGSWTSDDDYSVVEYNTAATSVSLVGAKELSSGFIPANSLNVNQKTPGAGGKIGPNNKANFIAQNIDSTDSEIYVIVVKNMTTTATNVGGSIVWKEIY